MNSDLHAVDVDFDGGEREQLFRARRRYREHGDRDGARDQLIGFVGLGTIHRDDTRSGKHRWSLPARAPISNPRALAGDADGASGRINAGWSIQAWLQETEENVTRPRAADDFTTIRARLEELRWERAQVFAETGGRSVIHPPPHRAASSATEHKGRQLLQRLIRRKLFG